MVKYAYQSVKRVNWDKFNAGFSKIYETLHFATTSNKVQPQNNKTILRTICNLAQNLLLYYAADFDNSATKAHKNWR